MGLRIKTNVTSLAAQRVLGENNKSMNSSLERLSSGQRINRSADDAAGLAVSQRLQSKSSSLEVAKRNASDGISYIQVAEGGLNEVTNIIVRMKELSTQAASDTIGNRERGFLDKEFQQLKKEIGRIQESTEFNGAKLLSAEMGDEPLRIFVGATNRGDVNGVTPDIDPETDPDIISIDLNDRQEMVQSIGNIVQNEALAVVPDDIETGNATQLSGDTNDLFNKLDTALDSIASYRASLGSVQSRLNSTITNIDISNENILAARSRIRDVDFASESTKFAQAKILSSASTAVLSQANQAPEAALALIR